MKNKISTMILSISLILSVVVSAGSEPKNLYLQVYLPREVTIKNSAPNLGQVAVIKGSESLVAKANGIAMGRISVPGQKIVIDRTLLLSRLASNGIDTSKVNLIGAEKLTIRQQQQLIAGDKFLELAKSLLKEKLALGSVCRIEHIKVPKDLVVPDNTENIKLVPRIIQNSVTKRPKVLIDVLSNNKTIATREVAFRVKFNCRRLTAVTDIVRGTIITPENTKIETFPSDTPELPGWAAPYGLVAKRNLTANTVIKSNLLEMLKPKRIVKRNQNIIIQVKIPGLTITASGKAKQDGRVGECIRVQNIDSKRIILAKVMDDGTVEPVF
ncbi:flagellar basal body P-ring formation chaperone FlgA [Planctomycetota bacterium]